MKRFKMPRNITQEYLNLLDRFVDRRFYFSEQKFHTPAEVSPESPRYEDKLLIDAVKMDALANRGLLERKILDLPTGKRIEYRITRRGWLSLGYGKLI